MNSLELKTVKNTINICGKKLAGMRFNLKFNNNQELNFYVNRDIILSSLGFKKSMNNKPSDEDIVKTYDNLSKMEKIQVMENADTIICMFKKNKLDSLNNFVMLIHNEFQNKLELIVRMNDNNYYSIVINEREHLQKFEKIDDISSKIKGENFIIPISFACTIRGKVLTDEKLSKKAISDAKNIALLVADAYDANFTNKFLKLRYVDSLTPNAKSYTYKNKISLH